MIDIIKAKKQELENFIDCYKSAVAKAEAKLEVYNEILAEVTEETATVEETHGECDCASCSAEETAQNDIASNI